MGFQNRPRVGKIKGILFSDCLPEREFRAYFAHSRLLRFVPQQNSFLWLYHDQVCSVTTAKSLGSFLFYYIFPVKLVFVLAYIKRKKTTGRFQPSCLTFRQQVKRINCKSRLNPVSTNAPSYFWQRLLGLSLGTGKENIVQLLSSAVTIPQVIARHISAPVRFLFPSVEYKMNCQSQGPPRNEDTQ